MKIYVSTGGYWQRDGCHVVEELFNAGIDKVELSGGKYLADQSGCLKKWVGKVDLQLHNYFPPPKQSFVLNLASADEKIAKQSFDHVVRAINLTRELGAASYAFHAGFLIDPHVAELGQKIKNRALYDRRESIDRFVEQVGQLSSHAKDNDVKLYIENNVLSQSNYGRFGANPLLMVDPVETAVIMERVPQGVGFLLDVAHLKVSATSLGFDKAEMFDTCHEWINAYHLSDNDGLSDSNEAIGHGSWFWPFLTNSNEFATIEVYGMGVEQLIEQRDLVNNYLG